MINLNTLFELDPFSMKKDQKENLYKNIINDLTIHHYKNCFNYKKIIDAFGFDVTKKTEVCDIPPLPVRLFKDHELFSVEKSEIITSMVSSGTTGQNVSKIFLDKITAANQIQVLIKIVSHFTGSSRLPMLIIDTKNVLKDRDMFSARGAGILGFSRLGHDITYALKNDMTLDLKTINTFLKKHNGEKVLIFGFTFIIWQYFYLELEKKQISLDLQKAIMIHGGGWKKLITKAIDNNIFNKSFKKQCGVSKIHNYYGMVEQTGSIYMECEYGYLHCSIFSDIIALNNNFIECNNGEIGLLKLFSVLPFSYPGHIILTEDKGEIIGQDDCLCGRRGKYFKVYGRVENAEVRGCSDTYEEI